MARPRLFTWFVGLVVGLTAQFGWAALADAGGPFTPNATQPNIITQPGTVGD